MDSQPETLAAFFASLAALVTDGTNWHVILPICHFLRSDATMNELLFFFLFLSFFESFFFS
jgi:hypothetical protein